MALRSNQITRRLKNDEYASKSFIGVFPRDILPAIKMFPSSLVINTDPSHSPGSHWLAVYFDSQKKCTFFDSYGNKPEYFSLMSYLQKYSYEVEYKNQRIQAINSDTCGFYCIFFLLLKSRGFSLEIIQKMFFENNFDLNDFLIKNV